MIRVAIYGLGNMGQQHLKAYRQLEKKKDVRVLAVCDLMDKSKNLIISIQGRIVK